MTPAAKHSPAFELLSIREAIGKPRTVPNFRLFKTSAIGVLAAVFFSGCVSLVPESKKLVNVIADTQAEVAATSCVYLYKCLWAPGAPNLGPGQTCDSLLPDAHPTPGFVAPAPCRDLHFARVSAEAHIAAAVGVAENGSSAPELRRKLKKDISNMKKNDARVRAAK